MIFWSFCAKILYLPQGSHSDHQKPAGPSHQLPMDHKNDEQWSYADHLVQIACGVS
jgi:hypothetical protein